MGIGVNFLVNSQVDEALLCNLCRGIPEDPVVSQDCGHIFCKWCSKQVKHCPIDQRPALTFSPASLESQKIATEMEFRCLYHGLGCGAVLIGPNEFADHERRCNKNPEAKIPTNSADREAEDQDTDGKNPIVDRKVQEMENVAKCLESNANDAHRIQKEFKSVQPGPVGPSTSNDTRTGESDAEIDAIFKLRHNIIKTEDYYTGFDEFKIWFRIAQHVRAAGIPGTDEACMALARILRGVLDSTEFEKSSGKKYHIFVGLPRVEPTVTILQKYTLSSKRIRLELRESDKTIVLVLMWM